MLSIIPFILYYRHCCIIVENGKRQVKHAPVITYNLSIVMRIIDALKNAAQAAYPRHKSRNRALKHEECWYNILEKSRSQINRLSWRINAFCMAAYFCSPRECINHKNHTLFTAIWLYSLHPVKSKHAEPTQLWSPMVTLATSEKWLHSVRLHMPIHIFESQISAFRSCVRELSWYASAAVHVVQFRDYSTRPSSS